MLASTADSAQFWWIGQNWLCYSARPFHALFATISCNTFLESLKHTGQPYVGFVDGVWNFNRIKLRALWDQICTWMISYFSHLTEYPWYSKFEIYLRIIYIHSSYSRHCICDAESKFRKFYLQGVQTLSEKSIFDILLRKISQISKVKIFSWPQMMRNLF